MKVKSKNKTYEYDTKMMVVKTDSRNKLKQMAQREGFTMIEFVDKLIETYEDTSN